MKSKYLAVGLTAVALALTGCGPTGESSTDDGSMHTYNTYLSLSPKTWNVHTWETNDESYIQGFCEMGLYDLIFNENRDGYDFMPEMASAEPEIVTLAELSDDELDTYYSAASGIGNPSDGMVWEIALNQDACWEDGTPITAADYVESMDLQLSPKYANYRADSYYSSELVLVNAENYFKQGRSVIEAAYDHVNKTTGEISNDTGFYYVNLGQATPLFLAYFTGETEPGNLYQVIENRSTSYGTATELAGDRIVAGVAYYLSHYIYTEDDGTGNHVLTEDALASDSASDWETVCEDINEGKWTPNSVTSDMFENDATYIDVFEDFDVAGRDVQTVTSISANWAEGDHEHYTGDDLIDDLRTFLSGIGVSSASWNWKLATFIPVKYDDAGLTIADVGIRAIDDYTIRLYLAKTITSLNLKFQMTGNWLVKTDLYKQLTTEISTGYYGTTYATASADNYMSYGPYKLTYFEDGKEITIERNENWYGYSDGRHTGMYQMDKLNTTIIQNQATAMNEFLAGRLDDITLTANDMRTYGNSSRRTTTMESYTQKISFNSDYDKLVQRQSSGTNKTVLANQDFRTALSLAIDRQDFAASTTAGSTAFTGLLNDLYLANNSTGQSYRSTVQGKSVYDKVYGNMGGSTIDSGTALDESAYGYNYALAVKYMERALATELASTEEGSLKSGQTINIEFRVTDATSDTTKLMHSFLSSAWTELIDEAKANVPGAESISFNLFTQTDSDYYTSASGGNYDMIFSIWGGAAINPYGLMQVYLDSTFGNCCEFGFKGHQNDPENTLSIDENGDGVISEDETKTFHEWYERMNSDDLSEAALGDDAYLETDPNHAAWLDVHNRKLNILAGTEAGVISRFEAVPIVARGSSSLNSYKIEYGSKNYISLIGYGGIRYITFNYTNAEWTEFVNQYGGNLSELYKQ